MAGQRQTRMHHYYSSMAQFKVVKAPLSGVCPLLRSFLVTDTGGVFSLSEKRDGEKYSSKS